MRWSRLDPLPIRYGYCPTEETWQTLCRRARVTPDGDHGYLGPEGGAGARTMVLQAVPGFDLSIVVCVHSDIRDPMDLVGLMVHEAVHVADLGLGLVSELAPGEEIRAYMVQRVAEELLRSYMREHGSLELQL